MAKLNFCKNTKTNETVTADRGTQSAPVAPAVGSDSLMDCLVSVTVEALTDTLAQRLIKDYLSDGGRLPVGFYKDLRSKGIRIHAHYSGVARRGGAPSARPENGKEV